MKKFIAFLVALAFTLAPIAAFTASPPPPPVKVKPTEGPDVRKAKPKKDKKASSKSKVPVKPTEGPDVKKAEKKAK